MAPGADRAGWGDKTRARGRLKGSLPRLCPFHTQSSDTSFFILQSKVTQGRETKRNKQALEIRGAEPHLLSPSMGSPRPTYPLSCGAVFSISGRIHGSQTPLLSSPWTERQLKDRIPPWSARRLGLPVSHYETIMTIDTAHQYYNLCLYIVGAENRCAEWKNSFSFHYGVLMICQAIS